MPSVFLSYSRDDLPKLEQLEAQLNTHPDISVWRDQEKIYGGQKWPKALGEAIADQEVFLLAWSKNAAVSHFVEFEWTTAIALKKTIITCLLDNTPLPTALRTTHTIDTSKPEEAASSILQAMQTQLPAQDPARTMAVLTQLASIQAKEKTAVLNEVRSIFAAQQWTVRGTVYQAGGDIHIHTTPFPQKATERGKPLIEKWETWVTIVAGMVTIVVAAIGLPRMLQPHEEPPPASSPTPGNKQDAPSSQSLIGAIRNEANDPLPDVQVSLPQFGLTKTTDHLGQFRFEVTAPNQETIALLAQRQGYQPYEADVTLGNVNLSFTMKKRK